MKDPFDMVGWALAFGIAWVVLTSMTGLDDFLKKLVGRKEKTSALEAKVEALEKRIAQLEEKKSEPLSAK